MDGQQEYAVRALAQTLEPLTRPARVVIVPAGMAESAGYAVPWPVAPAERAERRKEVLAILTRLTVPARVVARREGESAGMSWAVPWPQAAPLFDPPVRETSGWAALWLAGESFAENAGPPDRKEPPEPAERVPAEALPPPVFARVIKLPPDRLAARGGKGRKAKAGESGLVPVSVPWSGNTYWLSHAQRQVLRVLVDEASAGRDDVGEARLMRAAGRPGEGLASLFDGTQAAGVLGEVIVPGREDGTYRLSVTPSRSLDADGFPPAG